MRTGITPEQWLDMGDRSIHTAWALLADGRDDRNTERQMSG